jgi:hypothetical protein
MLTKAGISGFVGMLAAYWSLHTPAIRLAPTAKTRTPWPCWGCADSIERGRRATRAPLCCSSQRRRGLGRLLVPRAAGGLGQSCDAGVGVFEVRPEAPLPTRETATQGGSHSSQRSHHPFHAMRHASCQQRHRPRRTTTAGPAAPPRPAPCSRPRRSPPARQLAPRTCRWRRCWRRTTQSRTSSPREARTRLCAWRTCLHVQGGPVSVLAHQGVPCLVPVHDTGGVVGRVCGCTGMACRRRTASWLGRRPR